MALRNRINALASLIRPSTQRQQFADVVEFESQLAGMPDEAEAPDIIFVISPLFALGPDGGPKEANLLVVPDGRDLDFGPAGKLANGQKHLATSLNL
jgi:hypothetical protein